MTAIKIQMNIKRTLTTSTRHKPIPVFSEIFIICQKKFSECEFHLPISRDIYLFAEQKYSAILIVNGGMVVAEWKTRQVWVVPLPFFAQPLHILWRYLFSFLCFAY